MTTYDKWSCIERVKNLLSKGDDYLLRYACKEGPGGNKFSEKIFKGPLPRMTRDALEADLIQYTIPDKPNSRLQQYRLTEKGRSVFASLERLMRSE